jgi:multiple sugar transport system permease protein
VLIAVTFRLIDAAKLFDIIYSLTRGGPGTETYTSSYYLYQQGFELFHLGQGTAGALMFMVMLTFISFWLVRRLLKPVEA